MATQEDLTAFKLRKRVHELESENARYLKNQNIARKYEFRITGVVLLVIGAIVTLVAYPSYNLSPSANVLMMVGIGALFVGAVTMFLNTERFINQKVAEDLNLSSVTVVDDLLRDLRVKNKGVYLPSSRTGTAVKVFIPLRQDFDVPAQARLAEDRAFLIDLAEPAQEGILLKPLGYHLFRHTSEDLKADWKAAPTGAEGDEGLAEASEHGGDVSFAESLQDVVVKGLELADKVTVSENDGRLSVRLHNTSYARMCESLREDAPQVCEQIGCPLCSLIACAYTEHADVATVIEETHCEEQDITVICRPV
ncbi:MAG: hypothetical protein ACXV2A_04715 [Halobacteriota archaeon]